MLEIRPTCEHCNTSLPNTSGKAMICSFECTFCNDCVDTVLQNVCPNCGGGFTKRPVRPDHLLEKYPPSSKIIHQPVMMKDFEKLLAKNKHIDPRNR